MANRPARTILSASDAVQAHLAGLVDDTHPALRDDLDQLIIAEVADPRSVDSGARLAMRDALASSFAGCDRCLERRKAGNGTVAATSESSSMSCKSRLDDGLIARRTVSERRGQAGDMVLVGEEDGELVRQVGVLGLEVGSIDGRAGFDASR